MNAFLKRLVFAGMAVLMPAFAAHAVQIVHFDDLSAGTNVTNQYASQGVLFENAQVFAFHEPGGTAPNAICGATNGQLDCQADVILTFVDPTDSGIKATTDSISALFMHIQLGTNFLEAFDLNGNSLGQVLVPDAPTQQLISFSSPGIHQVVLHGFNDVAFDNIQFNDVVPAGGVPLPATLALFGAGLVLLAGGRRRRA